MDTINEIRFLQQDKNAIIVAHNYQPGNIQDLADFCGDSLELSRRCARIEEEIVVFCGVSFMAETAHLLSPDKTVLLPARKAGCPMADMAEVEELRKLKTLHPEAEVVCYVNSTATVKAESDLCVTSSNAVDLVRKIPDNKEIIFVPDRNLGRWVSLQTGRKMIYWDGCCPVHNALTPAAVQKAREKHPDALVIMHPECTPEALECADEVLSTGQMSRFVQSTKTREIIVATEEGMIHRLQKDNPKIAYYRLEPSLICRDMKMTHPEDILRSLKQPENPIVIDPEIAARAVRPIRRMLEWSE